MLINEEILAPVYYIIGGTKSGQVKSMSQLLPVMSDFIPLVLLLNNTQILTWTHRRITTFLTFYLLLMMYIVGYFCIMSKYSNNKFVCEMLFKFPWEWHHSESYILSFFFATGVRCLCTLKTWGIWVSLFSSNCDNDLFNFSHSRVW